MPITFRCPCGKTLRVAEKHAGKQASCPQCGQRLNIPRPAAPVAPHPAAARRANELGPPRAVASAKSEQSERARTCPICQCSIASHERTTACESCHAEYHEDCWQENGGCAVYGCDQVPPTEHRRAVEIPVSYWGRQNKPCPVCGEEILAAALRCRRCGATFQSARPEDTDEFRRRASREQRRPALRRTAVWLFVLCALPCTAPFAALFGVFWYVSHRADIKALPALYSGLSKLALAVGAGQTVLVVIMVLLFGMLRSS